MRVRVFYDEEGNEVAIARNRAEFEAADNALHAVPGARFTVKDEDRDEGSLDDESDDGCSTRHYPSLEGEGT